MKNWHRLLLGSYVFGSLPYRMLAGQLARSRGRSPVMILFYHRVADESPNPWTISNDRFARQIAWLQRRFDLISLEEAQRRIRHGNRRPAVSITFDDGYAENCQQALPLLIRHKIPCTYFVTTENIFGGRPFPHDTERGEPLRPNTIDQLRRLVSGRNRNWRAYANAHGSRQHRPARPTL